MQPGCRIMSVWLRFTPTRVGNANVAAAHNPAAAVHPHACGECSWRRKSAASLIGSPPRVWGMLHHARIWQFPIRFTPTRVGNANRRKTKREVWTVHPHACGECVPAALGEGGGHGSPPRVWGMRSRRPDNRSTPRFTPTRVGNASQAPISIGPGPVHPHACGECTKIAPVSSTNSGSPPRVWGMRTGTARAGGGDRFTPTRVGNAKSPEPLDKRHAVHPHACGECFDARGVAGQLLGSPPRVWGMHHGGSDRLLFDRFTPTRVGNAIEASRRAVAESVHPHACGECEALPGFVEVPDGSPPRVWGMRRAVRIVGVFQRFTPTRVGNAIPFGVTYWPPAVHPHACGECRGGLRYLHGLLGSPPRVWGMHPHPRGELRKRRFTPTRVGNAT